MKKWKCTICDYIHEGDEPPEECPICGADKSAFVEITEEAQDTAGQKDEIDQGEKTATSVRRWKCTICNYIHDGDEPPEICPVCGADKSVFVEVGIEEEAVTETVEAPETEIKATSDESEITVKQPESSTITPEEPRPFGFVGSLTMKFHLHAISVHTPNGVIPVAVVFLALGMFFSITTLEYASFFNYIFVLLSMPVVIATGIISWKIKYKGAKTWVFKTKLVCSFIVLILLTLMVIWRFIDTGIAMSGGTASLIYLGLGIITVTVAGIAGHLGGTLVHGK